MGIGNSVTNASVISNGSETPPARSGFRPPWAALGLLPFIAYIALFLLLPTVIAIASGMFTADGQFTWHNLTALGDPVVQATFWNSTWLALLTSALGAILGALICYALLGLSETGLIRTTIEAAAGVLAQFAGVMLAFAWIATIGLQGVITQWLLNTFDINIFENGAWIYALPGLIPAYLSFQIPLMVITFLPALTGLKQQWLEASLTLGSTRSEFWRYVGLPILAPSFFASSLLLFANAFSAYGTAAALASQGSQIVPLQIRAALTSETVIGRENLAGVLALGMIVIVTIVMLCYGLVQRKAARWQS